MTVSDLLESLQMVVIS